MNEAKQAKEAKEAREAKIAARKAAKEAKEAAAAKEAAKAAAAAAEQVAEVVEVVEVELADPKVLVRGEKTEIIHDLLNAGMSRSEVTKYLNESGVPTRYQTVRQAAVKINK